MREILFRGFHPCEDGGKTVYVDGKAVKGRWVEGWLAVMLERIAHINVFKSDDGEEVVVTTYPVILSTVGQYTGLTDKNGGKIFEGHVIQARFCRNKSRQTQKVIFTNGKFVFDNGCVQVTYEEIYDIKVIGYFHEEGRDERID